MSKPIVFIATYEKKLSLYWDERPLLDHLANRSIRAVPVVWSDDSIQWGHADLVLVRSCWDAHLQPQRFLSWLGKVEQVTTVVNDPNIIRWCFDKTYLQELSDRGVKGGPHTLAEAGHQQQFGGRPFRAAMAFRASEALDIRGWLLTTVRVTQNDPSSVEHGQQVVTSLLTDRDVMIQPYLTEFDSNREMSLIFIDGRFSHAFSRPSLLVHGEEKALAQRARVEVSEALITFAGEVLSLVPPVMWARVDVLDIEAPMLNELEAHRPESLMSLSNEGACYRWLAQAIENKLDTLL